MESIFKKPKLKKQTSRNAFDVSQKRVQHAPFGAILPCFCRVLAPDDYVELSAESQFICDTLARPAFIRLKEHINFYAVKIRSLWAPFDNFITGQDNYTSSIIKDQQQDSYVPSALPVLSNLTGVLRNLSRLSDVYGINEAYNAMRLLDLLEYGNFLPYFDAHSNGGVLDVDAPEINRDFNPFALAAYQKVYYDYYRNPKYEDCNVYAFNFDNISGGDTISDPESLLKLHYAWAKKDYFTDVQPSVLPSANDIGFDGLQNVSPYSTIFGVPGASSNTVISLVTQGQPSQGYTSNAGEFVSNSGSTAPYANQSNVTALRFAFAYDKLLRRMREAGGTFDKQMLAQFGIKPYEGRDGKCTFIGGQTNRLNASDVIAQSGSSENSLGFIGGNINQYSAPRSTFKYHASEYTIVIGMYHTSLDYDYPSYATSRFNQYMNRFDYFNPAFENLGLQPLYKFELLNLDIDGSTDWQIATPWLDGEDATKVLGYVRRYAECKTSVDKVFGLFDFGISVDNNAWVSQFHPIKQTNDGGEFLPIQVLPLNSVALRFSPLMFNQVVTTNYNGDWFTDPFKNHFYIHCKLIGNMSPIGESF